MTQIANRDKTLLRDFGNSELNEESILKDLIHLWVAGPTVPEA